MRRIPHLVLMILLGALVLAFIWMTRKYIVERDKVELFTATGDRAASARQDPVAQPQSASPAVNAATDPTLMLGDGTTTCPPGYPFKGKRSSKIFHSPGQQFYDITVATHCFATTEAAEAAGYRASKR